MAKKSLFQSNPLDDHPMFSKPAPAKPEPDKPVEKPKPVEKKTLKTVSKKPAPAPEQEQLIKRTYYLTNEMHKKLKLYALQNDMDISVLVRQIFSDFLRKKKIDL